MLKCSQSYRQDQNWITSYRVGKSGGMQSFKR